MTGPLKPTLRPIEPRDENFLFELYLSTRAVELSRVDWNEDQVRAFLLQQMQAQKTHYDSYYPDALDQIVEVDGLRVGRLWVHREPELVHILAIIISPENRGRGIGHALLAPLVEEARAAAGRMRVFVEDGNPARRLYLRLGLGLEERHESGEFLAADFRQA